MQTKVNKPQELNISSATTKTEAEQKKEKNLKGELRIGTIIQGFIQETEEGIEGFTSL